MKQDIPLRCVCGKVKAVLKDATPARANRVVCCCNGCRQYAHVLGREEEILNAFGGTEVFQLSPLHLILLEGKEHIACLQQTPKGALRWYASCCTSPLFNTLPTLNMPFIGVLRHCVDEERLDVPFEDIVGPTRATLNTQDDFPTKDAKKHNATMWSLFTMIGRLMPMFFAWKLRGHHKHFPFRDPKTGKPTLLVQTNI